MEKENSATMTVLILSDRLMDNARKLSDYLTGVGVKVIALAETKGEAMRFCDERINFLIIVGYLENKYNYGIIEEFKERKLSCIPVQWAILDGLIEIYCKQFRIPLQFDRTLPMSEFVKYLEENRYINVLTEEETVECSTTRSFWTNIRTWIGKQI
jgi:hypothetical protein